MRFRQRARCLQRPAQARADNAAAPEGREGDGIAGEFRSGRRRGWRQRYPCVPSTHSSAWNCVDTSRPDELVSAEVGALVGRCYVCLSLFARGEEYPKCDWVRAQAAILWLRRHGVELFDAGTTAEYYATNFGFRRCASREAFVELWRNRRSRPLATPFDVVCASACDDGVCSKLIYSVSP